MRRVAVIAAVFGMATIFAASSHKALAATPSSAHPAHTQSSSTQTKKPHIVVVQSGDTLSKLAKVYGSTMLRMFYANPQIENPDLIYPDEKLRVPTASEKLTPRALPDESAASEQTPAPADATETVAAPEPAAPASTPTPTVANGSVWDRLADCESGGNWSTDTGNGFYGGLQFTLSSWQAVGGSGYPSQASRSEQIARAQQLLASQGWGAWPACSAQLGL